MNKKKKWIITAIVLVVFCLILGLYNLLNDKAPASDDAAKAPIAPRRQSTLNVNGRIVRPQRLTDGITTVGNLLPDEEVDLSFETSGKIVAINFQEGTVVRKGELLAKVNNGEELTWDDLNSATWAVLNPTSASGYIYPSLWLQEHYGKGISDLDNVVECDSHTTSVARLAAGQVDVMVSYGHIRIKNAPIWESDFGGTAPMVEQTGVIGVTEGIYNDMIAYSKNSDTMADEDFRKALGESFIEIADTDEGREIISVFSQVGYTWGQDFDYDGERAAQELLKSLEG